MEKKIARNVGSVERKRPGDGEEVAVEKRLLREIPPPDFREAQRTFVDENAQKRRRDALRERRRVEFDRKRLAFGVRSAKFVQNPLPEKRERLERRRAVFASIDAREPFEVPEDFPSIEEIVREMRDER